MSTFIKKSLVRTNTELNAIQWENHHTAVYYDDDAIGNNLITITKGTIEALHIAIFDNSVIDFYAHIINLNDISTDINSYSQILTFNQRITPCTTFITTDLQNKVWILFSTNGTLSIVNLSSAQEYLDIYFKTTYIVNNNSISQ